MQNSSEVSHPEDFTCIWMFIFFKKALSIFSEVIMSNFISKHVCLY